LRGNEQVLGPGTGGIEMESVYFLLFCLLNAFIIYWALRNDDQETFLSDAAPEEEEGGSDNISGR
jgi:hypothetical protein